MTGDVTGDVIGDVIGDVTAWDEPRITNNLTAADKQHTCRRGVGPPAVADDEAPRPRPPWRRVSQVTSEVVLRRDRIVTATGRPAEERRATAWLADRPGLDFPYRCVCVCV